VRIWPHAAAASRGDEAARAAFDARLQEIMAGECAGACAGAARDFHFFSFEQKLQHLSSGAWTSVAFRTGCLSSFGWACGCATAAGLQHDFESLTR